MFVIAGVGGNTGSVAMDAVLGAGEKARALVRHAEKAKPFEARGAEVAIADLGDEAALTKAFAGAKGAYVLLPPNPTSPEFLAEAGRKVDAIAGAAKTAKLEHLVLLSSIGAHHEKGTGPIRSVRRAEKVLGSAVPRLTVIRAGYFMENFGASLGALSDGILPTFAKPNVAGPMVATRDIGEVAAAALLSGEPGIVNLAGPREYSVNDVAAALSKLVGREIRVNEGPEEAIAPTFQSFGMSSDMANLYREMIHGLNTGLLAFEPGVGRLVRGKLGIETVLAKLLGKA